MSMVEKPVADAAPRVVIFKDDELLVAQCLEYDIGVQAPDMRTLTRRLNTVLAAEREQSIKRTGKPFGGIQPAPQHYFDLWDRKSGQFVPAEDDGIEYQMAVCD